MSRTHTLALAVVLLVAGCGQPFSNSELILEGQDQQYLQLLPRPAELRLDILGEEAAVAEDIGQLTQALEHRCGGRDGGDHVRPPRPPPPEPPPPRESRLVCATLLFASGVNAAMVKWLSVVDVVTRHKPTSRTENSRRWGPTPKKDGLDWRLDLERSGNVFTWNISFAVTGTPADADAWRQIVSGVVEGDRLGRRGLGEITFDLDAAQVFGSASQGLIHASYDHTTCKRSMHLQFEGYVGEAAAKAKHPPAPLDAVHYYERNCEGGGKLEWAYLEDIHARFAPDQSCAESIRLTTRWDDSGAGRGDFIIDGGDLVFGRIQGSQCWNDQLRPVWRDGPDSLFWHLEKGNRDACVYDDRAEPTEVTLPTAPCDG